MIIKSLMKEETKIRINAYEMLFTFDFNAIALADFLLPKLSTTFKYKSFIISLILVDCAAMKTLYKVFQVSRHEKSKQTQNRNQILK